METLAQRWERLAPHVRAWGPQDATPRPTALLFHGCGGLRPHLEWYAAAATAAGWRAVAVDSYAPRGWGRTLALSMVCTGMLLRGAERAGDVLAAVRGVQARPDVDPGRLVLAGWSHGGWSIMDLMTMALERRGEAGLADPDPAPLEAVKGVALYYPYVGPGALSRVRPWRRAPRTLAVIAREDHLTTVPAAQAVCGRIAGNGCRVETWVAEGTHAFDEPTGLKPMRHDPELTRASLERFREFLEGVG